MTLSEAIIARHSVRAYTDQPIAEDALVALRQKIEEVNAADNLHVQLILDEPKAFLGTMAKYGKFRGVRNYLVMAGKKADDLDGSVVESPWRYDYRHESIAHNSISPGIEFSLLNSNFSVSS